MPIYRISAQEIQGIVIDDDPQRAIEIAVTGHAIFIALVRRAMEDHGIGPVICPPGITNITPAYWKHPRADHKLQVLPGAESAVYHVVPRNPRLTPAPIPYVSGPDRVIAQDLQSVRSVRIPDETLACPVLGPIAGNARIRAHEMIVYAPADLFA